MKKRKQGKEERQTRAGAGKWETESYNEVGGQVNRPNGFKRQVTITSGSEKDGEKKKTVRFGEDKVETFVRESYQMEPEEPFEKKLASNLKAIKKESKPLEPLEQLEEPLEEDGEFSIEEVQQRLDSLQKMVQNIIRVPTV